MSHTDRVHTSGLQVARSLYDFMNSEVLPHTDIDPHDFWNGVADIASDLMPINRALLNERNRLQADLDAWHSAHRTGWDQSEYRQHLERIGYLLPEPENVTVTTSGVDPEIAELAGPQLVVPITNARYALNAANARWGSLYDAFYGTDVLPGSARPGGYDRERGDQVISAVRGLLDEFFPLLEGSHSDANRYIVKSGLLLVSTASGSTSLADPAGFRGWRGNPDHPEAVLLQRHGIHWELQFDSASPVGAADRACISDVLVEAALTTIIDFEDSVAVVDADDKVAAYRNWLGLNRGDLQAQFHKNGTWITRQLADDRRYIGIDGAPLVLPGRSLLLVRNVGHLMTTDAILDAEGQEIGEGTLDAIITTLCGLPSIDIHAPKPNGKHHSIYIVKPKLHGPAEVALTVQLFSRVERLLKLPPRTIKLGLMDEERRTSVNLKACIAEAQDRLFFINTGFLDRSGDEIHTSMQAGPVVRKAALRRQPWILAYEGQNVDIGLEAHLPGHAQIGKGMWTMPDRMAAMLEEKIAHPEAGATTAWVPSPTAATLHALHYARVDVRGRQQELAGNRRSDLDQLLIVPIGTPAEWSEADRAEEVDNNVQSLLGYVVRWIDQGIGCSKVPDIHDIGLMEDRATLRISSQLLTNWLHHRIVSEAQVRDSLVRMAAIVDRQNVHDSQYHPLSAEGSIAFRAACDLIFDGLDQPNGYTEPILHRRRREAKARNQSR
ncbi:malate synthase G [Humibacter ginsengisoli]